MVLFFKIQDSHPIPDFRCEDPHGKKWSALPLNPLKADEDSLNSLAHRTDLTNHFKQWMGNYQLISDNQWAGRDQILEQSSCLQMAGFRKRGWKLNLPAG